MDRSRFFRQMITAPLLAAGIGLVTAENSSAQGYSDGELFDRHLLNGACTPYAVPSWAPPPLAPAPYAPTPAEPGVAPPAEEPPPVADVDQVFLPPAQGTLLASTSFAGVPSMVGDFFGVGTGVILLSPYDVPYLGLDQPPRDPEEPVDPQQPNRPPSNGGGNGGEPQPTPRVVVVPNPGAAGAIVGREKIADNGSPLPRDRVFFNYSCFDNVPLAPGGVDVNRFTPGFEKTFFDGMTSIEMRFPFATTLNSNFLLDGFTNDDELEFGNLMIYTKALLYSSPTTAIGSGLGISVPTADDLNVGLTDGTTLVRVQNESVHLLPYIGGIHAPGVASSCRGSPSSTSTPTAIPST